MRRPARRRRVVYRKRTCLCGAAVRLLLVDSPFLGPVFTAVFKALGHEALAVETAEEALEVAPTFSPDAIVSALALPTIDGCELCRRLRAMPQFEDTPIVAFSGACDGESVRAAFRAGFSDYVFKPARFEEVLEALGLPVIVSPPTVDPPRIKQD